MAVELKPHQLDALGKMHNGCILAGGVGSGKSITAISYYYLENGGEFMSISGGEYIPMNSNPKDLYIITTARKRDTFEWEDELSRFLISSLLVPGKGALYSHKVVIDSWNNIGKYSNVTNAFFIFDEQRVVGRGKWVRNFLKITKNNQWILLSATPGDNWNDYVPVFIANGYFKTRREFESEHVVFSPFSKFPKIDRYIGTKRLEIMRKNLLVDMDFLRETTAHHIDFYVGYNDREYKYTQKNRRNPYTDLPIETPAELCYTLRKVVNTNPERGEIVKSIVDEKKRVIVFYCFDYELDILRELDYGEGVKVSEWNGHKHEPIPDTDSWVYLVQYAAGAEGWNCITSNTIIFYSQNYSYKTMVQAAGRIDRLNTPYKNLYYYHLKSKAPIDIAISRALRDKKKFNEKKFIGEWKW